MKLPRAINLPDVAPPPGYSDATLAPAGAQLLVLGGHVAYDSERKLQHAGELVPQIERTLRNLRRTLETAGLGPEHLVKLTIHVTDVPAFRAAKKEIGRVWREVLGKAYPAMTLLGVQELHDEGAVVEIDGLAVLPRTP